MESGFRTHAGIENVYTQNYYLNFEKGLKGYPKSQLVSGLGQLVQHIKINTYDWYMVYNYFKIGVCHQAIRKSDMKVDFSLIYNRYFLSDWTLFTNYQNRTSDYYLRQQYLQFYHYKSVEVNSNIALIQFSSKLNCALQLGAEYKFGKNNFEVGYFRRETRIVYNSSGLKLKYTM